MEGDQQAQPPQSLPSAPFPAPPPFWKHFTTSNQKQLISLQQTPSSPHLDPPVAYLVPPPPPPSGSEFYTTFSTAHPLTSTPPPPAESTLLFDPNPHNLHPKQLLHTLTDSLLLNFLELTSTLAVAPAQYREKVEDLERIFVNAGYLVNLFRPWQAREGVAKLLQERIEKGEEEVRRCEEMKEKVQSFLAEVVQTGRLDEINGHAGAGPGDKPDQEDQETGKAKEVWRLIHELDTE